MNKTDIKAYIATQLIYAFIINKIRNPIKAFCRILSKYDIIWLGDMHERINSKSSRVYS